MDLWLLRAAFPPILWIIASCLQEWLKGLSAIQLTMPLWSWQEMKTCWHYLYQDKVGCIIKGQGLSIEGTGSQHWVLLVLFICCVNFKRCKQRVSFHRWYHGSVPCLQCPALTCAVHAAAYP